MLRLIIGFASLSGLLVTTAMAYYAMGMGGHWSPMSGILVFGALLGGLFLLPFLAAVKKAGARLLKLGLVATPVCSLPLFWFLIANTRGGADRQTPAVLSAVLVGYLVLSLILYSRQLQTSGE